MDGQDTASGDVAAQAVSHGWKLIDQYPAVGLLLVGIGVTWWLLKDRGKKGEDAPAHSVGDGAVLMAIGNLGELVREKTGHLGEQLKSLEKKMDDHADSDVREFGRLRDSVATIFTTQATHGQEIATLKARPAARVGR